MLTSAAAMVLTGAPASNCQSLTETILSSSSSSGATTIVSRFRKTAWAEGAFSAFGAAIESRALELDLAGSRSLKESCDDLMRQLGLILPFNRFNGIPTSPTENLNLYQVEEIQQKGGLAVFLHETTIRHLLDLEGADYLKGKLCQLLQYCARTSFALTVGSDAELKRILKELNSEQEVGGNDSAAVLKDKIIEKLKELANEPVEIPGGYLALVVCDSKDLKPRLVEGKYVFAKPSPEEFFFGNGEVVGTSRNSNKILVSRSYLPRLLGRKVNRAEFKSTTPDDGNGEEKLYVYLPKVPGSSNRLVKVPAFRLSSVLVQS